MDGVARKLLALGTKNLRTGSAGGENYDDRNVDG